MFSLLIIGSSKLMPAIIPFFYSLDWLNIYIYSIKMAATLQATKTDGITLKGSAEMIADFFCKLF